MILFRPSLLLIAALGITSAPSWGDDSLPDPTSVAQTGSSGDQQGSGTNGPSLLDCNRLSWSKSCEHVNAQYRKNPTAPIRMTDKDGLEYNFPPGTPTPFMQMMLDPSDENVADAVSYYLAHSRRAEALSRKVQMEVDRQLGLVTQSPGGLSSLPEFQAGDWQVYGFVKAHDEDSLATLVQLAHLYPVLNVSALVLDADTTRLESLRAMFPGLPINPLHADDPRHRPLLAKLRDYPTFWFRPNAEKGGSTRVIHGEMGADALILRVREDLALGAAR